MWGKIIGVGEDPWGGGELSEQAFSTCSWNNCLIFIVTISTIITVIIIIIIIIISIFVAWIMPLFQRIKKYTNFNPCNILINTLHVLSIVTVVRRSNKHIFDHRNIDKKSNPISYDK